MNCLSAEEILKSIQETIQNWHVENAERDSSYEIVTDDIRKIRTMNEHREDIMQVVRELAVTNTEMWHEEDKVRSMRDEVVLRAIRNINPLNQHRNDLIEEIDEIMVDRAGQAQ